ncbi:MAG: hypothetical protein KF799_13100 [Bdellovibrionales bacterium]|nr:hypothetical protein [Bdellovibrionales bacterium]
MFKVLAPAILIFASSAVLAAPGLDVRPGVDFERADEITTVQQMIPRYDNLQCQARCDGRAECGQFKDMDTCLDLGETAGCFWACD